MATNWEEFPQVIKKDHPLFDAIEYVHDDTGEVIRSDQLVEADFTKVPRLVYKVKDSDGKLIWNSKSAQYIMTTKVGPWKPQWRKDKKVSISDVSSSGYGTFLSGPSGPVPNPPWDPEGWTPGKQQQARDRLNRWNSCPKVPVVTTVNPGQVDSWVKDRYLKLKEVAKPPKRRVQIPASHVPHVAIGRKWIHNIVGDYFMWSNDTEELRISGVDLAQAGWAASPRVDGKTVSLHPAMTEADKKIMRHAMAYSTGVDKLKAAYASHSPICYCKDCMTKLKEIFQQGADKYTVHGSRTARTWAGVGTEFHRQLEAAMQTPPRLVVTKSDGPDATIQIDGQRYAVDWKETVKAKDHAQLETYARLYGGAFAKVDTDGSIKVIENDKVRITQVQDEISVEHLTVLPKDVKEAWLLGAWQTPVDRDMLPEGALESFAEEMNKVGPDDEEDEFDNTDELDEDEVDELDKVDELECAPKRTFQEAQDWASAAARYHVSGIELMAWAESCTMPPKVVLVDGLPTIYFETKYGHGYVEEFENWGDKRPPGCSPLRAKPHGLKRSS